MDKLGRLSIGCNLLAAACLVVAALVDSVWMMGVEHRVAAIEGQLRQPEQVLPEPCAEDAYAMKEAQQ